MQTNNCCQNLEIGRTEYLSYRGVMLARNKYILSLISLFKNHIQSRSGIEN